MDGRASAVNAILATLPDRWRLDRRAGLPSVCSAHPLVVEAVLEGDGPVLIEATCNQVNQDGGYTGMTPTDFRRFVEGIAARAGFPRERLILGGDHLGPNPWKHLDVVEAMARAERMVADYVRAGFAKIHLDASMGCKGEPPALDDALVAERAARLAAVAEAVAGETGGDRPLYVIGTEVPIPGGADHALASIDVTSPSAVLDTIDAHRRAFASAGVEDAFARVVAVVVQPGVEFDHERVFAYDSEKAKALTVVLEGRRDIVFEAHSTDYQSPRALASLVADGFAILKVGPGLTFAMREAFYGLDRIAAELDGNATPGVEAAMEGVMLADPRHWAGYYRGTHDVQRVLRHYSYSDRIRYYWPAPGAVAAVERLFARLGARNIPETLISQFLPGAYPAVRDHVVPARSRALTLHAIRQAFAGYRSAASEACSATQEGGTT
jgi:D-tagatose-1,6-bisphosphate aldolase subunit GatZ/KbaZ